MFVAVVDINWSKIYVKNGTALDLLMDDQEQVPIHCLVNDW